MTDDTVTFLLQALQRLDGGIPASQVQTHISVLLLGQTLAWKLKKAVHLPYLDTRSLDRRLALCERELALNRRTAPALYHRVRRLVKASDGALAIDAEGALVEPILEMQRFDEAGVLDRMAVRKALTPQIVTMLAQVIAGFHLEAEPAGGLVGSGSGRVGAILDINEQALRAGRSLLGEAATDRLIEATRQSWQRLSPLLDERQRGGQVRLCHGDLHLRNIVMIDGRPTLFDCLEFDAEMATTDLLYDLAFLLMDLWHRDLKSLANLLLNRYLDESDQLAGLPLLGLFMSMRAAIRAHVLATKALEIEEDTAKRPGRLAAAANSGESLASILGEARSYLELAARLLQPRPARLIAIGGLSGSGKSTTAAAIAADVGVAPGARVLSSDRIRKALFGVAPQSRLDAEAYQPAVSAQVYALQREQAAAVLASGHSVIVDAVFDRQEERERIEAVARAGGARFQGAWLEVPPEVLLDRVNRRRGDPSDADAEVVRRQLERDLGRLDWPRGQPDVSTG
jgi:aminoglycoside phosphotransferase family enzyme/predicted kinase